MGRAQKGNFLKENPVYIVIGITGALVIVLLALILGKLFGHSDKETKKAEMTVKEAQETLSKDVTPELKELIKQYYTAMSASDLTTMEQIVSSITDEEKEIIHRKKDYIEGYNSITVYCKKSPEKNAYLVFAGYSIKFKNEDTTVPGLETFYVKTSSEGNMYIDRSAERTEEVETFITDQLASREVTVLFEDVNNRYVDALASSDSLLAFMEGFGGDKELIKQAKEKAAKRKAQEAKAGSTAAPEETKQPQADSTAAPEPEPAPEEPVQQENETVLVVASVNLRKDSNESAERITTMIVGDQATRTGVTENGWSKVIYGDVEGYVKSDYVTTFKLTSDTVKTSTTVNVRTEASETANMAGQAAADTALTRYAVCDNGWSQVQYNGGVGYVKTEYLTQ